MARAPFQVLVFPFRTCPGASYEFALFKRADVQYWQGIAGGGEDDESAADAARREAYEEAGITGTQTFHLLDTQAFVPVEAFQAHESWPRDLYVIPEYHFAVEFEERIRISDEHSEFRWVRYDEALMLLHWDSNKTGLWELNKRLTTGCLSNQDELSPRPNAFWRKLKLLYRSSRPVIDRKKGSTHPRFPELVYPLDYGYLDGTSSGDGQGIDFWRGSRASDEIDAVICTVDALKRDAELKLLIGCTEAEMEQILAFHNNSDLMSATMLKR